MSPPSRFTSMFGSNSDGVTIVARDRDGVDVEVHCRYALGCDGANSTVRQLLDIASVDLGFFYDWLIVDVMLDEPRVFDPINVQVCDPARPTTVVSGGPGRRRWEFMRLPSESLDELNDVDAAWRLLAGWDVTPDNATLAQAAAKARETVELLTKDAADARAAVAARAADVEKARAAIPAADKAVSDAQRAADQATKKVVELRAAAKAAADRIGPEQAQAEAFRPKVEAARAKVDALKAEYLKLKPKST